MDIRVTHFKDRQQQLYQQVMPGNNEKTQAPAILL